MSRLVLSIIFASLIAATFADECTLTQAMSARCKTDATDKATCESAGCLYCGTNPLPEQTCTGKSGKCNCVTDSDAQTYICMNKEAPTCTYVEAATPTADIVDGEECSVAISIDIVTGKCPSSTSTITVAAAAAFAAIVAVIAF